MDLIYTEEKSVSRPYRDQYLAGVNALIERRRQELTKVREEFITPEKLAADPTMTATVAPSYRPDKAINIHKAGFLGYIDALAK